MNLSINNLADIKTTGVIKPGKDIFSLPEKVLQFGTGVLLRGLPDYFIDKANRQGIFNGRIVVVKSTDSGDSGVFDRQDGLYTLCVRGIDQGKKTEENIICSGISRVLSARDQWQDILQCAHNPEMQIIVSNTTEVGIQLVADDIRHEPPVSFPGKLLAFLRQVYDRGELKWTRGMAPLADPQQFARFLAPLYQKKWAVHAKPAFGGVDQSLKYLARYTYRVAISNERIESLEDGQVTFRYKDYAHSHRWRRMTLTAHEFLRRFLCHVLPRGFVRIRSFGFLANRVRDKQLALCRQLLQASAPVTPASFGEQSSLSVPGDDPPRCPHCGQGVLELVSRTLRPSVPELVGSTYPPRLFDSS